MDTDTREQLARLAVAVIVLVRLRRKKNTSFTLEPAIIAAIIAAVAGAGSTIYSTDQSRKRQHEQIDASKAAQEKQFAEQEALAQQQSAASEKQTSEANAAAMRRRAAELQGQTGPASVSPEFYSSILSAEFPSASQDDVSKAVQSFFSGGKG